MKQISLGILFVILLSGNLIHAQGVNLDWAKKIGGPGYDYITSVLTDSVGNVYLGGHFFDSCDLDPGLDSLYFIALPFYHFNHFVEKLDSNGNLLWVKVFGGTQSSLDVSMTMDEFGNIYMTGRFNGILDADPGPNVFNLTCTTTHYMDWDVFIIKLDVNGDLVWAKSVGGVGADIGEAIDIDSKSNVLLTGVFYDTVDFDPGPNSNTLIAQSNKDIFILKLSSSGSFIWAKSNSGSVSEHAYGLAIDDSDNIVLTGTFDDICDFDPGSGVSNIVASGMYDLFVQKLDSSGNLIWIKHMNGISANGAYGMGHHIAIDNSNNIVLVGEYLGSVDFDPGPNTAIRTFAGNDDVFALKLDNNGNFIWVATFGGTAHENTDNVFVDPSGKVYIIGSYQGTVDFDPGPAIHNEIAQGGHDIFLLKLNGNGQLEWVETLSGPPLGFYDEGKAICVDVYGNIYGVGIFEKSLYLDPGGVNTLNSQGDMDGFIVKYVPDGLSISKYHSSSSLKIYPNPAENIVCIENDFTERIEVILYNSIGNLLSIYQVDNQTKYDIDISHLETGVYYLTIRNSNGYETRKIIKY